MKEEKQIEYQFTAVPTTLFLLLDNNCRSMLFTLIQLSTMYSNSDRYFYRSNEDLQSQSNLSKNLVIATIDTLYINKIVDVKTVGKSKGKYTNEYKLNFDKIKEYDKLSIEDTKNPSNKIAIVDYKNNYQPQYIKDYLIENEEDSNECKEPRKRTRKETRKRVRKEPRKKVNTNIYNIDSIESLENKDNIYNIKDNIYSNIYSIKYNKEKSEIEETTNVEVANEVANAKTFFNDNFETEDKIKMNETVDMLFNDTSTDTNTSNETANAETSIDNGKTDCSIDDNITADAITSNKAQISTLNENITDSSTNDKSFNRELKNDINTDNSKESINNKNKLNMKQQAKEYFKTVLNEVSRLNRINSTDVSKLKIYYDVIKTLSIDEIDKKEMLDKCNEYIDEISSKKIANAKTSTDTSNKTDIPTLEEKTTDTSIEEISSNTELKNNADADTSIDESFNIEEAIKNNMEFQRYYTNINVAFTKRSIATLRLYEKMFSSNVEYLSKREIEELKNLASDAKRKLQVELNIAS
ncbi:hypothetical protein [Bacteroides finegoldii]|uniref:hypothetical protein n=1 Tax=Bacteroides finegoldii TaxID=338188 RepID=UPI00189D1F34|nr:hypothetical protein [Bacteroides finegoldii]